MSSSACLGPRAEEQDADSVEPRGSGDGHGEHDDLECLQAALPIDLYDAQTIIDMAFLSHSICNDPVSISKDPVSISK